MTAISRKTLYLDCDGVILPSCQYTSEFIELVVSRFDPVWISDRHIGYRDGVIDFLEDFKKFLSAGDIEKLYRVRENPSSAFWKHERIDYERDFIWIDDAPMGQDRDVLRERGMENRLIIVKSWRPESMLSAINLLKKIAPAQI